MFDNNFDKKNQDFIESEDFPLTVQEARLIMSDYIKFQGLFDPKEYDILTEYELNRRREFLIEASDALIKHEGARKKVLISMLKASATIALGYSAFKLVNEYKQNPEFLKNAIFGISALAAGYTLLIKKGSVKKGR